MNKLNKFVTVLSKIIAIFFWIGCGFLFVGLIASVIFGQDITALISRFVEETPRVNVHGLEIDLRAVGPYALVALTTLCIAGIVTCGLHAMIFRNINLIFRTADGKTKYSKGASPFQPEIVRMVREIGIFCIVIPVFELIVSFVLRIIIPPEMCEISVNFSSVVMGLVVLCLSQYFAYGAQLQEDVDGLV
jgi:hypothetical protein